MKLYILINNGGDGSYHPSFVLDKNVIDRLQEAYDQDLMDYENGPGVDGDGFHYTTVEVPDGSTPKSLDVGEYSFITMENVHEYVKAV